MPSFLRVFVIYLLLRVCGVPALVLSRVLRLFLRLPLVLRELSLKADYFFFATTCMMS